MLNWAAPLKRRKLGHSTPVAELREFYDAIFAEFGHIPSDVTTEPAQLGQLKGEWLRVGGANTHRVILYLHGGGYIAGSAQSHRPLVARLCRVADAGALSLDYRLAPEFPFPAGLRDTVDAYRFLLARGIAPKSIVLAGDGSGGGLAFAAVMAIRNAGIPMPAGIVAMSPFADLTLSGWSMLQHAESDTVLCWEVLFCSARHYLKGGNPGDPYASPSLGNLRDFPPIMVHSGSLELLRDDAARLGDLAAEAGVPVSVEVYEGQRHLFQAMSHPDAKVSLGRMGQFVRKNTLEKAAEPEAEPALNFSKAVKASKRS